MSTCPSAIPFSAERQSGQHCSLKRLAPLPNPVQPCHLLQSSDNSEREAENTELVNRGVVWRNPLLLNVVKTKETVTQNFRSQWRRGGDGAKQVHFIYKSTSTAGWTVNATQRLSTRRNRAECSKMSVTVRAVFCAAICWGQWHQQTEQTDQWRLALCWACMSDSTYSTVHLVVRVLYHFTKTL